VAASAAATRHGLRSLEKGDIHERGRVQRQYPQFLKTLGVTAQREIEKAVREALADGRLKGNEKLPAEATVAIGAIKFSHEVGGEIELE
jgi:hypothetical protein